MSLARYADPAIVIQTSLELGQRGRLMKTAPDGDTADRIATLLRQGCSRGIVPQWTLRLERGASMTRGQMAEVADQVADGFTSGECPKLWRVDIYE